MVVKHERRTARLEGIASRVDAERDAAFILRAVAALRSEDRDLLILSGWEHLNSTEIGRILNVPAATVRSRARRLRSELQASVRSPSGAIAASPTGAIS